MSVGDLPESFVICQLLIVLSKPTSPKTTFQLLRLLTLLHQKHINNLLLKTTVTDLTMSYKQKFCLHVVLHQLSVNVNISPIPIRFNFKFSALWSIYYTSHSQRVFVFSGLDRELSAYINPISSLKLSNTQQDLLVFFCSVHHPCLRAVKFACAYTPHKF